MTTPAPEACDDRTGTKDRKLPLRLRIAIALALTAASWLVYSRVHLPSSYNCGDNLWIVPTALSIIRHGDIDVNEYGRFLRRRDDVWINRPYIDPRLVTVGDRYQMLHPIGSPIAILPLVALHCARHAPARDPLDEAIRLTPRLAPPIAAASVGLLFLLLCTLGATLPQALIISLTFGYATPHFVTHADGLWSHNIFLPFLIATLWLLVASRGRWTALAGLTAAIGYIIRPESSIFIICMTVWLLITNWRRAIPFIATGSAVAIAFLFWSRHAYGNWLPPYYIRTSADMPLANLLPGLINHIFCPNRGIAIFAPILLFGLAGGIFAWLLKFPFAAFHRAIALAIAIQLAMISMYDWWWAGASYGPRYFCPVLPLYTLLLLPLWQHTARAPRPLRTAIATTAIAACLWGLFVNIRGITDPAVHDWNNTPQNVHFHLERLWDWNDLQILRGWGAP